MTGHRIHATQAAAWDHLWSDVWSRMFTRVARRWQDTEYMWHSQRLEIIFDQMFEVECLHEWHVDDRTQNTCDTGSGLRPSLIRCLKWNVYTSGMMTGHRIHATQAAAWDHLWSDVWSRMFTRVARRWQDTEYMWHSQRLEIIFDQMFEVECLHKWHVDDRTQNTCDTGSGLRSSLIRCLK